jgi:hypothetical protein
MKRTPRFSATLLLAAVSLCGAARVFAQDAPPQETPSQDNPPQQASAQPKPAGHDYQPFGDDPNDPSSLSTLTPDATPLTGALVPGVGTQDMRHSYWAPGFQYGNVARSTTVLQPTVTDWNSTSFVAGNLSLLEQWSHSQLTVNYTGGGTFSTDSSQGNSFYHQLGLVQAFTLRRWQVSFIDQFSYLPQTQFGFGASSPIGAPGVGGSLGPSLQGLQSSYQPSQNIFAALGNRYSNSITTQIVYQLSPRGSVTLSGSYGFLKFVQPGNIDSNDSIFSLGYNYTLTKNDTIGVLYRFSDFQYLGNPQAIQDHVAQLAYGRKITGRLAMRLFAGPELTAFRVHMLGSANRTSVSGGANLSYALARTNFSVNYNHGVAGGCGVFTGSNSDTLQGVANRQLSRVWHGNISFGYARNSSLPNEVAASLSPVPDVQRVFCRCRRRPAPGPHRQRFTGLHGLSGRCQRGRLHYGGVYQLCATSSLTQLSVAHAAARPAVDWL